MKSTTLLYMVLFAVVFGMMGLFGQSVWGYVTGAIIGLAVGWAFSSGLEANKRKKAAKGGTPADK